MNSRILIASLVLVVGALAAAVPLSESFLGASAGLPVAYTTVALPPVAVSLPVSDSTSGAPMAQLAPASGAFDPSLKTLLEGNTVIRTARQMRQVWKQLFAVPYDASLFDFDNSYVVLMGGGVVVNGSFGITAVEQAIGNWSNNGGFGGGEASEPFIAVTSTSFQNGAHPEDPPPAVQALSAVRIPNDLVGDVLFHRALVLGI